MTEQKKVSLACLEAASRIAGVMPHFKVSHYAYLAIHAFSFEDKKSSEMYFNKFKDSFDELSLDSKCDFIRLYLTMCRSLISERDYLSDGTYYGRDLRLLEEIEGHFR